MNTISSPTALSRPEIRGIFSTHLTSYQFSIHELYKRVAMRNGAMHHRNPNTLNFFNLPDEEIQRFMNYLEKIGTWQTEAGKKVELFVLGCDDYGKLFLKLRRNKVTLAIIQLLNAIYDNMRVWKDMKVKQQKLFSYMEEDYYYGLKWIEHTEGTPTFNFC